MTQVDTNVLFWHSISNKDRTILVSNGKHFILPEYTLHIHRFVMLSHVTFLRVFNFNVLVSLVGQG